MVCLLKPRGSGKCFHVWELSTFSCFKIKKNCIPYFNDLLIALQPCFVTAVLFMCPFEPRAGKILLNFEGIGEEKSPDVWGVKFKWCVSETFWKCEVMSKKCSPESWRPQVLKLDIDGEMIKHLAWKWRDGKPDSFLWNTQFTVSLKKFKNGEHEELLVELTGFRWWLRFVHVHILSVSMGTTHGRLSPLLIQCFVSASE